MENIEKIIRGKNPDEVTDREFKALKDEIDRAISKVNELQQLHRELTGVNHVPDIKLNNLRMHKTSL